MWLSERLRCSSGVQSAARGLARPPQEAGEAADAREEAANTRAGEHGPGVVEALGKDVVVSADGGVEGRFDDLEDDVKVDEEEVGADRVDDEAREG
eukprot:scaffold45007_cov59-Phaeocystis_antarctica.AAC.12